MGSEISVKLSGVIFTLSDFPVPSTKKQFIGGSHPPLSICSVKMRAFVPPANGLPSYYAATTQPFCDTANI